MSLAVGSAAAYVEAARNLAPQVRQLRGEIEMGRNLPTALVEAMAEAGFLRLCRCRALGGPELDFAGFLQVIEELSRRRLSWLVRNGRHSVDPAVGHDRRRRRPRDFRRWQPARRQRQPDRQGRRRARRLSRQRSLELRQLHRAQSLDGRQLDRA